MKKFFVALLFFLFLGISTYIQYENSSYYKVFAIKTPTQIYIDFNRNHIFDERESYNIENIYPVTSLKLNDEQKFLFNYFENELAVDTLKNKYVKLSDNELYIDGKKYKDILLNSDFFFDESSKYKIDNILKKYNTDDYVILNTKSRKYHRLHCEKGKSSKKYKILNIKDLPIDVKPCGYCNIDKSKLKFKNVLIPKSNVNKTIDKGNIKIFFIDINSVNKPNNKCKNNVCEILKNEIDKTENSLDFAIYGLNSQPEIIEALIKAKNRGVKIRWVSDFENKDVKYYPDIDKLKINLPDYNTNYQNNTKNGIMHNKFFIFDNKKVWTGSSNITSTDLTGFNANYTVLINSETAAKYFKDEFEQMYNGKFSIYKEKRNKPPIKLNENTRISILFSPEDKIIQKYIIPMIENAKSYIYAPVFFITDKNILNALISAKNRGVEIKVINDATNSHSIYSIHKKLREEGIKVKTENYAGKMHMKSIIIDDRYSTIGSMNFTRSGENKNDENVIIIDNKEIAKYMKSTFLTIWNKIPEKYETYDPRAESLESIGSCFDGIDNNFDGKIDMLDDGCKTH